MHTARVRRNENLDSNWIPTAVYKWKQSLRVLCRSGGFKYPTDGYKLFSVSFITGGFTPSITLLDQAIQWTGGANGHFTSGIALSYQSGSELAIATAELINGTFLQSNLVCLRMTNDSIIRVGSVRCDSIVTFNRLHLDGNTDAQDYIIASRLISFPDYDYRFYPVNPSLTEPVRVLRLKAGELVMISGRDSSKTPDLCSAQYFYNGDDYEDHLVVLKLVDSTTSSVSNRGDSSTTVIQSPNPIARGSYVEISFNLSAGARYSLKIVSELGQSKIIVPPSTCVAPTTTVDITKIVSDVSAGRYWYILTVNDKQFSQPIYLE